jgi:stage II sporulation protein D
MSAVTICLAVSLAAITLTSSTYSGLSASWSESSNEDNLDQRMAHAAEAALGERRGTVIVMDPQTGRVRAVVNSKIAFEENLPPGSTIKPFTALSALRSGLIDEDSHTLCREKYSHEGFETICSHPRDLAPLNPTEAIAYSCNYYFGKVGERLDESTFDSTLAEFGFGKSSGINVAHEAQGKLPRNGWHSQNAIGESDELQATPIQLIDAYAALVNGGHLFTPRVASARGFLPELRATISIKNEYRSLIVKGMRGAVRYGTAETANLYSLPVYIFGKTGTATQINGFRSQGWFVGFASPLDEDAKGESESAPEKVRLAVLVFLTKAHGSEAAQVARPIFEEYARFAGTRGVGDAETRKQWETEKVTNSEDERLPVTPSPRPVSSASVVRVHLVREDITREMSLEDYVAGVVAAEGSTETEPEALKALAIASRTYAMKNIGRHSADGFDFCTTTHCQRYRAVTSDSGSKVSAAALQAVHATNATKGEVLFDAGNQVADSYFSASCGGATANISTLWGAKAPPYLRGVADEYCETDAHHKWTDVISEKQLLKAMQSDPRTNVGDRLVSVRVLRQDASGRAEIIALEGERRLTVKGWDFKIIVGRVLGWNLLKSSRFEIARSGSNFVFRGSGFGHGLGLCQEGAHVMATRGANYRQILGKYFPGTTVETRIAEATANIPPLGSVRESETVSQPRGFADLLWSHLSGFQLQDATGNIRTVRVTNPLTISPRGDLGTKRFSLRNESFLINYPATVNRREIETLLRFLQSNRIALTGRIAGLGVAGRFPVLEIFINETTGDFVGRTGQPPWAAAATKGNLIELQPLETLRRRRILETTVRHELVHILVDSIGRGRTPRWLAEGLALHLAGEGQMVARYTPARYMATEEIDKQLVNAKSADDMKTAYAAAYSEVKRLINKEGEANVWRRVAM